MRITYDPQADAMYIQLTDQPIIKSRQINANLALDLDEAGETIGIEILNVRKAGIDPLVDIVQTPADQVVERPDPEVIRQGRMARMEALKRQREKESAKD